MWTQMVKAPLFVCLIPALAAAQAAYTVTDLGSLSPTAINTWAQVVGKHKQSSVHLDIWSCAPFGITIRRDQ